MSGGELQQFVKMNRSQLKALDVDYAKNTSRVKLMPILLEKLAKQPVVEWTKAPPKPLPAPAEPAPAAALLPPLPPPERADSPPPTARPDRVDRVDEAAKSIEKPPEKRTRA